MTARKRRGAPAGLGDAGTALWSTLMAELEFDAAEVPVLELLARSADTVAALEVALEEGGLVVPGSKGQARVNPVAVELRQARAQLLRQLRQVLPAAEVVDDVPGGLRSVPGPPAGPAAGRSSAASKRAAHAAEARWKTPRGAGRGSA